MDFCQRLKNRKTLCKRRIFYSDIMLLLLLLSLVLKYATVCEPRNSENMRSFQFSRHFDNNNVAQEPYKAISGGNSGEYPKCLIRGAMACISDPNCRSFGTSGQDLLLYKCTEGDFQLKVRCPCGKGMLYISHLDICYTANSTGLTFNQANDACVVSGGHLLVLHTEERFYGFLQAFNDIDGKGRFWLGAHWVTDRLRWMNGEELPIDAPYWHENEPFNPVNNFVVLSNWGGIWALDDQYQSTRYGFICEY